MKDRGCGLLLPLAIVGVLAGLRHHADALAEQEAQLTRQSDVFRMHYRAGDDGRVELLDLAAAPDGPAGDDGPPHRLAHARCRPSADDHGGRPGSGRSVCRGRE